MTVASRLGGCALVLCLALPGSTRADLFDPVLYDLKPGSLLIDDCLNCDRPTIEEPLAGSFLLTRLPVRIVGELYSVTEIDFKSTLSDLYAVSGEGKYYLRTPEEADMTLDLEVNGQAGIQLTSGTVSPAVAWPAIDIQVTEDGQREPLHVYTIRIVASPRPQPVRYELVKGDTATFSGSIFIDDCLICGRPTIPIPVGGSFELVPEDVGGPNPFNTYRVESLDIQGGSNGLQYKITGGGKYAHGGEVALSQEMELTVQVNDDKGVVLASGRVAFPDGVSFPVIVIDLQHQNPQSQTKVYSLHLEAKPAEAEPPAPQFRRGDPNADGVMDISDAVFTLIWLFSGGGEPSCQEAADANDDGIVDLTDAVFGLDYLFRAGQAPPDPGPAECGSVEASALGCVSYNACDAAG